MRNLIQSLGSAAPLSMHDLVRHISQTSLLGSLRRASIAGDGLPERMRSTAFAFLGLTAAAGLAMVALFAHVGFSVLSPGPAPGGPVRAGSVSKAVALERGPAGSAAVGAARPSVSAEPVGGPRSGDPSPGGGGTDPVAVASPAPVPAGAPSGGIETGGGNETGSPAPSPQPAPAPAPSQAPSDDPPAASQPGSSAPTKPTPKPPPAQPAAPEPEPAPAPGNSQSSAAAANASERGIEASSKSSTAAVAPETDPGNGNGKALGHDK